MEYLVFEVNRNPTGYNIPILDFCTIVRANTPKDAIQVVMSATGRIGKYAVVECEWTSYSPFQTEVSEDGLLVAQSTKDKEITNGEDH